MVNGEPRHCGDGGECGTSTNLEQSRPMLAPPSLAESEILVVNWEWINLVPSGNDCYIAIENDH